MNVFPRVVTSRGTGQQGGKEPSYAAIEGMLLAMHDSKQMLNKSPNLVPRNPAPCLPPELSDPAQNLTVDYRAAYTTKIDALVVLETSPVA